MVTASSGLQVLHAAQHSTAQHSTAQHSTAQHSNEAEHSTQDMCTFHPCHVPSVDRRRS